jgi:phosphoribosylformimino-5-aminoimidazole carboxamide ribonucleotide (ProFAR) isomerase
MQPQMVARRLDANQPRAIANRHTRQPAVPVEIGGPIQPRNPIERLIGSRAVARFVVRVYPATSLPNVQRRLHAHGSPVQRRPA